MKKEDKQEIGRKRTNRPLIMKVLSIVLALSMIFTSSGMQVLAEEVAGSSTSTETVAETSEDKDKKAEATTEEKSSDQTEKSDSEDKKETDSEAAKEDTAAATTEEESTTEKSSAAAETTTAAAEETSSTDTTEEEEATTAARRKVTGQTRAGTTEIDLAEKNSDGTWKYLTDATLKINGTPIDALKEEGQTVPYKSSVSVVIKFANVTVNSSTVMTYQIPEGLVDNINPVEGKDLIDNKSGNVCGTYSIDSNGLVYIEPDQEFLTDHPDDNGNTTIDEGNFTFSGSLSGDYGKVPDSGDDQVTFGPKTFTIPFDYANYYANVNITKKGELDLANRQIHYTVTVSTAGNKNTATNVIVKDKVTNGSSYLVASSSKYYLNPTPSNGSFAESSGPSGTWTIGEMAPDQEYKLTYDFKFSDNYLTDTGVTGIGNSAAVTFNESGENDDTENIQCDSSLTINKTEGTMVTDDNGIAYMQYTITVTAPESNSGPLSPVKVIDKSSNNSFDSYTVVSDTYTGEVETEEKDGSLQMVWTIGEMQKGTTEKLTYNARIRPEWLISSPEFAQDVKNTATVYVGGSDDGNAISYGSATTQKLIKVDELIKNQELISNAETKNGYVKYTIKANSDYRKETYGTYSIAAPLLNMEKFEDTLSGSAVYDKNDFIIVSTYDSAKSTGKLIATNKIPMSEVGGNPTDTGDYKSWTLNLSDLEKAGYTGIYGRYYYEIVYYAKPSTSASANVTNTVNGYGNYGGETFSHKVTKTGQVGYAINVSKHYNDSSETNNSLAEGNPAWYLQFKSNIPAGAKYYDYVNSNEFQSGKSWIDQKYITGGELKIIQYKSDGSTYTLQEGDDYEIAATDMDGTSTWNSAKDKASGFTITFKKEVTGVSEKYPVKVFYNTNIDLKLWRENSSNSGTGKVSSDMTQINNYYKVRYSSDNSVETNDGPAYKYLYYPNPIQKTYNADESSEKEGTLVWDVQVNRGGIMSGTVNVTENLPDGLYLKDVELLSPVGSAYSGKTTPTVGTITDADTGVIVDDSNREDVSNVNIEIKDLRVQEASWGSGDYNYGGNDAVVTLRITTQMKDGEFLSMDGSKTYENTISTTCNDLSYTSSASATITEHALSKVGKYNEETYPYVLYTIKVNDEGVDLLEGEGNDTITLVDEMSSIMRLAIEKDGYIKVTANGEDITSDCKLKDDTNSDDGTHKFYLTVPDDKAVVVEYYAAIDAVDGEKVDSITNQVYYEGYKNYQDKKDELTNVYIQASSASVGSGYRFNVAKITESGTRLADSTIKLCRVVMKDGKVVYDPSTNLPKLEELGEEKTVESTNSSKNGLASFGTDYFDADNGAGIYCYYETEAPENYVLDSTRHYFEFKSHSDTGMTEEVTGITNNANLPLINHVAGTSYQIPVAKTVNGETNSDYNKSKFSFTLTADTSNTNACYTDSDYKDVFTQATVQTEGTESTKFDKLRFNKEGTYLFNLKEDDLTYGLKKQGFEKDTTEYQIKIVVVQNQETKDYEVESATFNAVDDTTEHKLSEKTPTFNNTYGIEGNVQLEAKKVVDGRKEAVGVDEFNFTVDEVDENGDTIHEGVATGSTLAGGEIEFTKIYYTDKDIGEKYYVISEVQGNDETITYTSEKVNVTVTVAKDDEEGTLEATATYPNSNTFTNTYNPYTELELGATKKLTGKRSTAIATDEFEFIVTDEDDKQVTTGYTQSELKNASVHNKSTSGDSTSNSTASSETGDQTATVKFKPIRYTSDDIGKTFEYTIREDIPDTKVAGVTYSDEVYTAIVTVTDKDNDGTPEATATYKDKDGKELSENEVVFTNKYEATGELTLNANKVLTGGRETAIGNSEFEFKITEKVGEETKEVSKGVTSSSENLPTSKAIDEDDEDGNTTQSQYAVINFETIKYTTANIGTHTYTMSEVEGNDRNITYSKETCEFTVTVSDNGDGTLKVETTYPQSWATFTNNYVETAGASYQIPVTKKINGQDTSNRTEEFQFTLEASTGDNNPVSYADPDYTEAFTSDTVKITGAGTNNFPTLYFKKAGTYQYTLSENDLSEDAVNKGYTKDNTKYYISIVVEKNTETKALEVTSATSRIATKWDVSDPIETYPLVFNNTLKTANVTLEATKKLTGNRNDVIGEGEFQFVVTDKDGNQVATGTTNAGTKSEDGSFSTADIEFTPIEYTKQDKGEHIYTISEVTETNTESNGTFTKDSNITYTNNTFNVTVTVTVADDGTVSADAAYPTDGITFVNAYNATGSAQLNGTKELKNRDTEIEDGEFTFQVTEKDKDGNDIKDEDGNVKVVATGQTVANKNLAVQVHVASWREVNQTVSLDGDSSTTAASTEAASTDVLAAIDDTDDGTDTANNDTTNNDTANNDTTNNDTTNNEAGTDEVVQTAQIAFTPISYTQDDIGTHTYTVSEVQGEDSAISYSTATYTVTVVVSDAGNGNLKVDVTYPDGANEVTFENNYCTGTEVTLEGTKVLTGRRSTGIAANEFKFDIKDKATGNLVKTGVTRDGGSIQFDPIKYGLEDAGKTFTYLVSEEKGSDTSIDYSKQEYEVTVEVTNVGNGVLKAEPTYPNNADGLTFTNAYKAEGTLDLVGTKKITGNRAEKVQAGEFNFTVKENGKEVTTGTTEEGGSIKFGTIHYTQDDIESTHTYVITEDKGNDKNIAYSNQSFTVTATISDAGSGELKVEPTYPEGGVVFTNAYSAKGELNLKATKKLTGNREAEITAGEFDFKVMEGTTEVATGTTKDGGEIDFTKISYTQDNIGTHIYTISEVEGSVAGIDYVAIPVDLTVEVRDTGNGKLEAVPDYPEGGIVFTNAYLANDEFRLHGEKILTGNRVNAIQAEEFTFTVKEKMADGSLAEVKDEDGNTLSGKTEEGGDILFGKIKYNQEDIGKTHTYVIKEDKGDDKNITYTEQSAEVTVTVRDAGKGELKVEPTYPTADGKVIFTNDYKAEGTLTLAGTKELTGKRTKPIQDGEFNFTVKEKGEALVDSEGHAITGTTSEGGEITFTEIHYNQDDIGDHTYEIVEDTENIQKEDSIDYKADPVTVTVKVTDDGKGNLTAKATYPGESEKAIFVNAYKAVGEITLSGEKEVTNRAAEVGAEEFTFTVKEKGKTDDFVDSDGHKITGTTSEGGIIAFNTIHYTQDDIGTHTYEITENTGTDKTITYDTKPVEVTVTVSDAGNGKLATEAAYPNGGLKIVNTYKASGSVELNATKKLAGSRATKIGENEFTFTVKEGKTEVATGYTLAEEDGVSQIKFTSIPYTQEDIGKTHTYVISEDKGSNTSTIDYAENKVTVKVEVTDGGNGTLNTKVTYPETGSEFINQYKAKGSVKLTATKVLKGNRLDEIKAGEFTFNVTENGEAVKDAEGNDLVGKTLAGGEVEFGEISYTQDDIGTHEYVISEDAGTDGSIAYIAPAVKVTVNVSDISGEGKLKADVTYPEGGATFVNKYLADGEFELAAEKQITGNRDVEIGNGEFTFTVKEKKEDGTLVDVKDEDGNVVYGKTLEGGLIEFNTVQYTQEDVGKHVYVITEDKGNDAAITYETDPVEISVLVTDLGGGKLSVTAGYPEGGLKFVNEYNATGSVDLTATKILEGNRDEQIGAGEFTFTVTEDGEKVATGATKEGGEVEFTQIKYDQDDIGTHNYVITEDKGEDETITYTADPVNVTVKVSDKAGSGKLDTEVTYPDSGALFVNQYTAAGDVTLYAAKKLAGNRKARVAAEEFEFVVKDENGVEVASGKTDDIGEIEFTKISYTQDQIGTHTYTISEKDGEDTTIGYTARPVTVNVTVSDAGNGVLNTEAAYPNDAEKAAFTNHYYAEGEVELAATKELTGNRAEEIQAGEFTFAVTENGEAVKDEEGNDIIGQTLAGGEIEFPEIVYTQDDIGTHEYEITEIKGEDGSITYTSDSVKVTVVVSDAGNGELDTDVQYPEGGAKFVNAYNATGSVELTATKKLTGKREEDIQAGEFTFTVTEDGNKVATGATKEGGEVEFTKISYTQDDIGTHEYLISEDAGTDGSIGYVADPVTVTVTVSDAGNGKLNVETAYPEGGATFTNNYNADGTLQLAATKVLTGSRAKAVQADEFTFSVTEDGKEVATGTTLEGGTVKFTDIKYTQEDIGSTHTYVITENKGDDKNIDYTADPVTVTVKVSDAGKGKLKVDAEYPEGGAVFTNDYKAAGEVELTATKEVTGNRAAEIGADEFTFSVTEDGKEVATGATKEGGAVEFTKISYTQDDIGTHTYVITENQGTDKSINYTSDPVTVTVEVSDISGEGKLNAEVTYPDGGAKFVNAYKAEGSATFTGTKELTGNRAAAIGADEFTFSVTEDGKEVATGATKEGGEIQFTKISYTQDDIGTHEYVITENKGEDGSITYTSDPVNVTVKVSDAGNGKLNADVTYPEGGVKFVNAYSATGSVDLTATKTLKGNRAEDIQAGEFTFTVTEDGTEVATGKTQEGGAVEFTTISYTQEDIGTHEYLISEDAGTDASIGYVADPVKVTVTVSDAGNGKLNAEASYPEGGATFTNNYNADGTFEMAATKQLTGNRAQAIQEGEFSFIATENGEQVATGETKEGGTVSFSPITYTQDDIGTHTYVISENAGTDSTIDYTTDTVTVTVTVSDAGNGKLNVEAEYPDGGAVFTNAYKATGETELTATKKLTGGRSAEIAADEFTFTVTEDGNEVATGTTKAGGEVEFTKISYTQDDIGTHTYVISENAGTDETIDYTTDTVTVTVTVSDAGNGKLNAEVVYPDGGAVFTNTYHTSGTVNLTAKKELTGATLQAENFTFTLKDENGNVLQTKKNNADGTVTFDPIEYNESDIGNVYNYTVSEVDENATGFTYSKEVYSVQVTVSADSDNKLTTETKITDSDGKTASEMLFENSFSGKVTLTKSGKDGKKLENASFALYQKSDDGWTLYTADQKDGIYTTGEDGTLTVTGLTANEYYFTETTPPEGYLAAKDADGSNTKFSFQITTENPSVQVAVEDEETSVKIEKKDTNGNAVKGAVLRVVSEDGTNMDEWTTDGKAHEITGVLTAGQTYRVVEVSAPEGYKIADDVTFTVNDSGATNTVTMTDQKKPDNAKGTAQVTKHLTMSDEPMAAQDSSFYVALFEDEDCTKRVSNIETLEFINGSASVVEFENLEINKTYYVSETDANGTAISRGTLETGEIYMADYDSGQAITVKAGETAELSFENEFFTLPDGFYLIGEVTIRKQVLSADGEAKNSDETFYAGIFEDSSFETLAGGVSQNIVALNMDGNSEVSTTIEVELPDSGDITLYVTEVDENGIPVGDDDDFEYEVEISGSKVTISQDDYLAGVVITNTEKADDEEPAIEDETTSPKTTKTKSSKTSSSAKTGDRTPIEICIALLGASVVILFAEGERRRRRNKKNK
jgi:pilin isopeptide linkage protein